MIRKDMEILSHAHLLGESLPPTLEEDKLM